MIYWFLQVRWFSGIYALFDDGVSCFSKCVFGRFLKFINQINELLICWDEKQILEFMYRRCHWLGFNVLLTENWLILSGWASNDFESPQRIYLEERVEVVEYVIFSQLVLIPEARLEKVLRQLILLRFPSNVGIAVVGNFSNLANLWMFSLKFAELLLFANCRSVNKI